MAGSGSERTDAAPVAAGARTGARVRDGPGFASSIGNRALGPVVGRPGGASSGRLAPALRPADMLALQRSVGNAAATATLARAIGEGARRTDARLWRSPPGPALQRAVRGDATTMSIDAEWASRLAPDELQDEIMRLRYELDRRGPDDPVRRGMEANLAMLLAAVRPSPGSVLWCPPSGAEGQSIAGMDLSTRLWTAVEHAALHMSPELVEQLKQLKSPEAIALMVAFIGAQFLGWGEIADVAGFAMLAYKIKGDAVQVAADIRDFFILTLVGRTTTDLDEAGKHLAHAVTLAGVDVLLVFLAAKGAKGKGARPEGEAAAGGAAEGAKPATTEGVKPAATESEPPPASSSGGGAGPKPAEPGTPEGPAAGESGTPSPGKTAVPKASSGVDNTLSQVERDLASERARVASQKAQMSSKAWARSRGGLTKRIYNLLERRAVLNRMKTFPGRQYLEQAEIVGVKSGNKLTPTRAISTSGTGRIADILELDGPRATLEDLKSPSTEIKSVKGGMSSPEVEAEFRSTSEIAKQHAVEAEVIAEAKQSGGTVIVSGRDPISGATVEVELDPAAIGSRVTDYNDIGNN